MRRGAAFALLARCLAPAEPPGGIGSGSEHCDWDTLLELARDTATSAALGPALRAKGLSGLPPPEVFDFLDGMAELNRLRNAEIHAEALSVARILNAVGVVPVMLKGAANLLGGLYPDPAWRIMLDLDLLVPADTVLRAAAALRGAGYVELSDIGFPAHHHYPAMGRPGGVVSVELHAEPLDLPLAALLPAVQMLAEALPRHEDGAHYALPPPRLRAIQAIAHAELADHAHLLGRIPLKDLVDVALLARQGLRDADWAAIAASFAAQGEATALDCHRLALEALLGIATPGPPPGPVARLLFRRALRALDHPGAAARAQRLLRPWLLLRRALSGPALRAKLLRSLSDAAWWRRQWERLRR